MKTIFKWVGMLLFFYLGGKALKLIDPIQKEDTLQDYSQKDQERFKYGNVLTPDTVYIEKHDKSGKRQVIETFYYDPDHPDVLYPSGDIEPMPWLFPTGVSRRAYPPNSQLEREWRAVRRQREMQSGKRYKPNYTIEPVETSQ